MAERQEFPFALGELSIMSTEEIDAGENFLDSDPNDVSLAKKKGQKESEKKKEQAQPVEKAKAEEEPVRKLMEENEFFGAFEEKEEEEQDQEEEQEAPENEDEGEKPDPKKEKKTAAQKIEEKMTDSEKEEENQEQSDVNPFATIAKELVEHGVLTLDEGEEELNITTGEQLLQRFQAESIKQARFTIDKFIGRFGPDYQDMFDSVFLQGIAPGDYLSRYTRIQDVADIDINDEANQERVVRELLRSEGRSSEYIDKAITRLRNYGDLADEAKEAKDLLMEKEKESIEQMKVQKAAELERKQQMRTEYLTNVNQILTDKLKAKEFDGIPVDRRFAETTHQYITEEKYQTSTGQLLTEFDKEILDLNRPEKHEMKVKIAMIMQLLKQDPTLSRITKKAVSKETRELFKGIQKMPAKAGASEKVTDKQQAGRPTSWFQ